MAPQSPLSRRKMVRQLILGTAVSVIAGAWCTQRLLAVELPDDAGSEGRLTLDTGQFPALAAVGGSVRLNVGLAYPIVVSRGPANTFYAVSTRCQHLGCIVNAYDPGTGLIRCTCHGSTYQIDGSLAGGPAERGLESYPISFDGQKRVSISLPGVTFAARRLAVESVTSEATRLRIDFRPMLFSTYQIQFQGELAEEPRTIPFALTPTGPTDQTRYTNQNIQDPYPTTALYVDLVGGRGFFNVVLLVTPY